MVLEQLDIHLQKKKINLDTALIPFPKFNSKWIIELNVKHKTIKVLEDNTRSKLDNLGYGDGFFKYNTKDTIHERKNDKRASLKLKIYAL